MKILLLDIETFPHKVYAWGLWQQDIHISQIVEAGYTACWAAKWLGESKMHFYSIHEHCREEMLRPLWDLLDEADAVVHYNGKRFDIPTINKEFLLAGMTPPSPYKQIDLLPVCRREFKLASNKLDYVSQSLGLGCKTKHMGMDLWLGCMNGDAKAWRVMEKYNKQDVKLLEKVYHRLLPWIENHPNYGVYLDTTRPVCRNCGSSSLIKKGMEYTSVGRYQRYKCTKCGHPNRDSTNLLPKEQRKNVLR